MQSSSSGSRSCEPILLSRRLAKLFKMNWTEGTLYRHSRGKLRKANMDKQRQKEYFAKAHIRAAEQREAMKNGPPPVSYLQPNLTLPGPSPDALHADNVSSHGSSHLGRRWGASVPTAENPPKPEHLLPTVDQFLKEQVGKAASTDTVPRLSDTSAGEVERLRQKLLASKDWGATRIRTSVQVNKQPQAIPEHVPTARDMRATKEKPAQIPLSISALYPQKITSGPRSLRRTDVQIRVGSQEKRLSESSSLGRGSFTHKVQGARPERSRHFMRDSSGIDDTHHIVTSIPNISHPVPRRAIPGHLLLSSGTMDSAKIASHVAQVGQAMSPVPLSQKAENSIWKAWLEESSSAPGAQTNSEQRKLVARPRISPGVSERHESRYERYSPPAQERCVRDGHITLPEVQVSDPDARSNVPPNFDRPVFNVEHSTPSAHRRFSVLLETPSNVAEQRMNNGDRHQTPVSNQTVSAPRELTDGLHQLAPIDAWRTFVFGDDDSEELERDAFSEARHDAVSRKRPHNENSLPSIGDEDHSGQESNIAMAGTSSSANAELTKSSRGDFAIELAAQSARKTHEPASLSSQPTSASLEEHVFDPWDVPLATSRRSVVMESLCVERNPVNNESRTTENKITTMSDVPDESTSVAASVATSGDASLVVEPAKSRIGAPDSEEQFRFAPPRPFVGKHSIPARNDRPSPAIAPVTLKRKRGRPRKRARDGRADIRALPNYSGDPIEEVEDEEDAAPPSLFGSLDVCYDQ
ncbi:hypothetical protein B0T20DRAFT_428738 [Sordaria brevicollis]|uniref:Uncharacterized protein n=1 Tax=Sordaria brevicollis TaxID=83679 RepID=A0AAE0PN87_SORBR|nr:hypothetical protein B0T20DRAFT_428738 [Sordaria brevicollis]